MPGAFRRILRRKLAKVAPGFARAPLLRANVWLLRKKQARRLESEIKLLNKKLKRENFLRDQALVLLKDAVRTSKRDYAEYRLGVISPTTYGTYRRHRFDLAASQKTMAEHIADLSNRLEGKQKRLELLLARFKAGK